MKITRVVASLSLAWWGLSAAAQPPVETCGMLDPATVAAAIGPAQAPPKVNPPTGTLLGGCEFTGAKGTASVTAHPADELDGTVRSDLKKGRAKAIAGLGEKAFHTPYGVLVQPAGKSYFLSVFVMVGMNYDAAVSEKLARKLKP